MSPQFNFETENRKSNLFFKTVTWWPPIKKHTHTHTHNNKKPT